MAFPSEKSLSFTPLPKTTTRYVSCGNSQSGNVAIAFPSELLITHPSILISSLLLYNSIHSFPASSPKGSDIISLIKTLCSLGLFRLIIKKSTSLLSLVSSKLSYATTFMV